MGQRRQRKIARETVLWGVGLYIDMAFANSFYDPCVGRNALTGTTAEMAPDSERNEFTTIVHHTHTVPTGILWLSSGRLSIRNVHRIWKYCWAHVFYFGPDRYQHLIWDICPILERSNLVCNRATTSLGFVSQPRSWGSSARVHA